MMGDVTSFTKRVIVREETATESQGNRSKQLEMRKMKEDKAAEGDRVARIQDRLFTRDDILHFWLKLISYVRLSGGNKLQFKGLNLIQKLDDRERSSFTSLNTRLARDVLIWPKSHKSDGAKSGLHGKWGAVTGEFSSKTI
jgi:hypothetical protein